MGFNSFFIHYWWILLILLILLAFALRTLAKIIIGFIIFFFIFLVVWQLFVATAFVQANSCFSDQVKEASDFVKQAELLPPGDQRDEYICKHSVSAFARLQECFESVAKNNRIGFSVYSSVPKFKEIIQSTVAGHNKLCPANKIQYF